MLMISQAKYELNFILWQTQTPSYSHSKNSLTGQRLCCRQPAGPHFCLRDHGVPLCLCLAPVSDSFQLLHSIVWPVMPRNREALCPSSWWVLRVCWLSTTSGRHLALYLGGDMKFCARAKLCVSILAESVCRLAWILWWGKHRTSGI